MSSKPAFCSETGGSHPELLLQALGVVLQPLCAAARPGISAMSASSTSGENMSSMTR